MITAFLDIHTRARCDPPAAPRAIAKRRSAAPPKPTEASTTSMHAMFEPLPPEDAGPRAAEAAGRELWQGPVPGQEEPPETGAGGDWESAFMDEEERAALMEDGDDVSEPDFEADSLEAEEDDGRGVAAAEELSSSVETVDLKAVFGSRRAGKPAGGGKAVYSGPLLCCEDDDFD